MCVAAGARSRGPIRPPQRAKARHLEGQPLPREGHLPTVPRPPGVFFRFSSAFRACGRRGCTPLSSPIRRQRLVPARLEAAMATDPKPAAVATPSVPVSTGRLIPWSTEEDELLRQVRRPLRSAAPSRGRRNPTAAHASLCACFARLCARLARAGAAAPGGCSLSRGPGLLLRALTAGLLAAGPTVGRAARVQKVGSHRLQDAQQGLQAVPAAVAELPEQRGRQAGRLERR